MADLTDVITSAIHDASPEEGETDVDTSSDRIGDTGDAVGDEAEGARTVAVDDSVSDSNSEEVVAEPAKPAVVDEITKELESQGVKAPIPGERENRVPYSRVKKITENYGKKLIAAHTREVTEVRGKLTDAEAKITNWERAEQLAATDPDRYMELLATINPDFKKYLEPRPAAPAKADPAAAAGAKPEPDLRYEDGSTGYSAEGLQKLLDWNGKQAELRAIAASTEAYDKRFGPIEQKWKNDQYIAERLPDIRAKIATARETWGKAFEDDYALDGKSEIVQLMQAYPDMSFETAVAKVLVPKTAVDRDRMRADIYKELNGKKAAASKTSPAAIKAGGESSGPRSMEDVIREQIATLK